MAKDDKAEGCGYSPVIFRGWAKLGCRVHDIAYLRGSWHQANLSRYEVDRAFLFQLLELAKYGRFKPLKRLQAYGMYGVVRLLGGLFWEGER